MAQTLLDKLAGKAAMLCSDQSILSSLSLALGFSLHNRTDGYREATERSITQGAESAESEVSA